LVHKQVQGHLLKFIAQVGKLSEQTLLTVSITKYRQVDAEMGLYVIVEAADKHFPTFF